MKVQRFLLIWASLFAVSLASCAVSENPIIAVEDGKFDPELCGVWLLEDDQKRERLCINELSSRENAPVALVRLTTPDEKAVTLDENGKQVAYEGMLAIVATIGENHYLQLMQTDPRHYKHGTSKVENYTFFKYRVVGKRCEIFLPEIDAIKNDLASGRIKGEASRFINSVKLTDSTANLKKWITENDARIFAKKALVLRLSEK